MNIKKRLQHLSTYTGKDRALGRTTALMKAAKEIDALVLAYNHDHATHLQRKFGVKAKSMESNLEGYIGPFIFDHRAVEVILDKAANKIEELEKENKVLRQYVEDMAKEIGNNNERHLDSLKEIVETITRR